MSGDLNVCRKRVLILLAGVAWALRTGGGCDWFLLFFVVVALGSHPCSILSKELHMRSEVWRVAEPFIRCRWF